MKKFIRNIIILFLLVVTTFFIIALFDYSVVGSQYKYGYQASLIDKVERLKSLDEPKIILVGNSNLSFGIDSELIEKELGMPVVNLGLHGSLGNAFHEQISKICIGEGDILVVCHTSFSDDDKIPDPELAWITYDYNNELLPVIRRKDYIDMLISYPTYLRKSYLLWLTKRGNIKTDDCYSRMAFNEYGDVVFKPEEGQMDVDAFFSGAGYAIPQINDTCVNRLNELNQFCLDCGAKMCVAGYPIAFGEYATYSEDDFISFEGSLRAKLDCDVISNYTDYFYPYEYFYNTMYHLTEEGTKIRTKQLIKELETWIDEEGSY